MPGLSATYMLGSIADLTCRVRVRTALDDVPAQRSKLDVRVAGLTPRLSKRSVLERTNVNPLSPAP
jgi:hypothetical protein